MKNKLNLRLLGWALASALGFLSEVDAATYSKANNTANLNLTTSWATGVVPTNTGVGQWDSTVTSANTVSLGGNLEWLGVKVVNPGGPVTLSAGNTLSLDGSGVDLSTATQDLTANCDLTLGASQSWTIAAGRNFTVGGNVFGTALLTLPGAGTNIFNGGSYSFGTAAAGNNALALNAGTLVMAGGTMNLAANNYSDAAAQIQGGAVFRQTGGVVNSSIYTRVGSTGQGTLIVSGGQFNNPGEILIGYGGNGATGSLVVSNTGRVNANFLRAGNNGRAYINLNGGLISANRIFSVNGLGSFAFNGGILQVNGSPLTPWFESTLAVVSVQNGGAIIDTAGQSATLAANLSSYSVSTGGLTKTNSGTLTLTGTNSYAGPTLIAGGTLAVNGANTGTGVVTVNACATLAVAGSLAGAVTVNAGATLTGTGSLAGAVTVQDGGTLAPGSGTLTVGSLTLGTNATLALKVGAPTNSSLLVNGNLVLAGTLLAQDFGGAAVSNSLTVINYTGTLTNLGITTDPRSQWNVQVDTTTPGQVKLVLLARVPTISFSTSNLTASNSLQLDLSGTLTGLQYTPLYYEVRTPEGRLWDFGATPPTPNWNIHLRHLREGTNNVRVFITNNGGALQQDTAQIVLQLGANPPVRPRPYPAEIWWGGVATDLAPDYGYSQLTDPTRPWDFVKKYQDGIFLHAMLPSATTLASLATTVAPYNGRFGREGAYYTQADPNYGINTAAAYNTQNFQLAQEGVYLTFHSFDYAPGMKPWPIAGINPGWCDKWPNWSHAQLLNSNLQCWTDFVTTLHTNWPGLKLGWTWSPVYFNWGGYPCTMGTDALILHPVVDANGNVVLNQYGTNAWFDFDLLEFFNQASATAQAGDGYWGFASDCPYSYFAQWSDPTARAINQAKILAYEEWQRTNGYFATTICNGGDGGADTNAWDASFTQTSFAYLQFKQQVGGRTQKYLFESYYSGPYTWAPESNTNSFSGMVKLALKYLKGIADTNGTLEPLALGVPDTGGAVNQISLTNNGDIACLPAITATETGSSNLVVLYYNSDGQDITAAILGADGYSPTNLVSPGQSLTLTAVVSAWPGAAPTASRTITFEAFWNPQDPTGVVRDRKTVSVSAAVLPPPNLIVNGDFTANAVGFTNPPGYLLLSPGNPSAIASWVANNPTYGIGVNGPLTSVGDPFGPTTTGGRTYAFIQQGGGAISQSLPLLLTNQTYQLDFDVSGRSGLPNAGYQVQIADSTQTIYTTNGIGTPAAFNHVTATFTTPALLNGTPSIQLLLLSTNGISIDFANVSLIQVSTNSPTTTALVSSLNPSPTGASVTFTATVTATQGGSPTNEVRFLTNGVAAALVSLNGSAQAAYTTSLLPHGTNIVTAEYVGDGNFLASTNSLTQVVNTPPVANPLRLGSVSGLPATLKIIGNAGVMDPEGDPLMVTAVSAPANGIASTDGTNATYTATNNFVGTDSFNYSVSDNYGGTATNTVTVSVVANSAGLNRLAAGLSSGNLVLTFSGIPWNKYALDQTFSLSPAVWLPVVTNLAPANGTLLFTNSPAGTNTFWRIRNAP